MFKVGDWVIEKSTVEIKQIKIMPGDDEESNSSESVLETKTYYNTDNERYEVWNNFLEAFIFENGITKVEEFKEFIYEFVISLEFSRTNYSNNAKLVSELDKKYINLFV